MKSNNLPRRVFEKLSPSQMAVANAMAHRGCAREWVNEARRSAKELRSVNVAFARAAHAAYRRDIKRALAYVRHGL